MAEWSNGRKQETPEGGVERWIMMMKEEEEECVSLCVCVCGGGVMIGQHPEANRSSREAAERKGAELKESGASGLGCGGGTRSGSHPAGSPAN